jgi:membrane protease YdiL (CAAX protease family)
MDSFQPQSSSGASGYPGAPWAFRRALARGEDLVFPWWGMGDAVIALVGAVVMGVATGFILMQVHIDPKNGWGLLISFIAPWLLMAGWPILATINKGNGPTLDLGLVAAPPHRRLGLLGGFASILVASALALLIQQFTGPFESKAGDLGINQHGIVLILFLLLAMFGAPIVEEVAFRGMLYGALSKAFIPQWAVVVITAAAFALFHFEPKRFVILFVIGLILGEVRRRTGSTTAAIIAHVINNTPAAIGILLTGFGLIGS